MCRFTSSACVATSNPDTIAFPEVGLLKPVSIRMAVVLPAPFAPRKPNISPFFTSNEIASTAVKLPNFFTNCSTRMIGSVLSSYRSCSNPGGQRTERKRIKIFSGVSMPRISPSCKNAIRSHRRASSIKGVDTIIVTPCSFNRLNISQNSFRETGSTPVVGSSRKSTSGLWIKAQQRASFCFIPPESAPARRLLKGSICR